MTPDELFLGAYLADPATVASYAAECGIEPSMFSQPAIGELYSIATSIAKDSGAVDRYSLFAYLESRKEDRLIAAMSGVPRDAIPHTARKSASDIARSWKCRRLDIASVSISERVKGGEDPDEIATEAESYISTIRSVGGTGIKTLRSDRADKVDAWRAARDGDGVVGTATPWQLVNDGLGGLRPKTMSVLGAYRGTGKSSATRQIIYEAAQSGTPCGLITLEDPSDIASAHIASIAGRFSPFHLDRGDCQSSVDSADKAWREIEHLPVWIYDRPSTIQQVEGVCTTLAARHGVKLFVVDHIQYIMQDKRYGSRNEEVGQYSMRLAALAKRLDAHVLVCSQLSRESEKMSRPPRLSDLRDSGSIEQDARQVLMLYREPDGGTVEIRGHTYDQFIIEVAKNNYGRSGDKILMYRTHAPVQFSEIQKVTR